MDAIGLSSLHWALSQPIQAVPATTKRMITRYGVGSPWQFLAELPVFMRQPLYFECLSGLRIDLTSFVSALSLEAFSFFSKSFAQWLERPCWTR